MKGLDKKPNILFILADDLGWGDVSYHGSEIETPTIDRLTARGVELDQHYVCPLCTPSRTSLLTGEYPGRFGRHATVPSSQPVLPDNYPTLASILKENGYSTALFGKWHLGSDPEFFPGKYGFDYSYGSLAGGVDPYTHRYKSGPYSHTWHRNGELIEEKGHATDLITAEVISWIKSRDEDQPWFCYLPYTAVHTPIRAPEKWQNKYWLRNYDIDPARDSSFKSYAAYVSHLDSAVGKIVESLKHLSLLENTIIVFTSDNGAVTYNPSQDTIKYPGKYYDTPRLGSNYPLRGHKAQLYEGGIRTPAAIFWQHQLQPTKIETPLYIADWLPTFVSLLDLDYNEEEKWDGIDISSLLFASQMKLEERSIYWNLKEEEYAYRQGKWKLILDQNKNRELYNLDADPEEEQNLASNHPEIVDNLFQKILSEQKQDNRSVRSDIDKI
ncbi:arylsulfatase A-like enzyme [Halanaerobium saccharolyticum]|uniref:Arylsulfatase A-like enzyme n=1 Tax=Halanaerobium saccharolyticum TaxID=43595 RepID=A0A4R6M1Y1_9FIRM|nr:sulfatase-like hydrolase/transferase [Halanaerobium saccharolyticum]TDO95154.1 arylsulfatase A-like enzyme [Halanaerobium saccharolyticum]